MRVPVLQVTEVSKRYRNGTLANDRLTLAVERGEIYGLLGPNGAGKTTLVRQLAGLLRPTSRAITVDGVDVVADPGYARRVTGFLPQATFTLDWIRVGELIESIGRLRGLGREEACTRRDRLIEQLELEEFRKTSMGAASGGVRRLAGFATAVVAGAQFLVLDEPTNDVDPVRRQLMWNLLTEMRREGTTVLLVTHNLAEAERVLDRFAIINNGRIVREGTPAGMRTLVTDRLRLELTASAPLEPVHCLTAEQGQPGSYLFEPDCLQEVSSWLQELRAAGIVADFRIGPPTLDDIYLATLAADTREPRDGGGDMSGLRQYLLFLRHAWQVSRDFVWFIGMVNLAFAVGLVLGFGYLIPDVSETTALFLVTGAATQMLVTVGLVFLPQQIAQAKSEGRLDYYWTLPVSRDAFLLAQVTFALLLALPAVAFALALGAWKYGFTLDLDPLIVVVIPLGVLSLAGFGIAVAVSSPHMQLTNAFTQLMIFYVLFFAPVIFPKENLPEVLQPDREVAAADVRGRRDPGFDDGPAGDAPVAVDRGDGGLWRGVDGAGIGGGAAAGLRWCRDRLARSGRRSYSGSSCSRARRTNRAAARFPPGTPFFSTLTETHPSQIAHRHAVWSPAAGRNPHRRRLTASNAGVRMDGQPELDGQSEANERMDRAEHQERAEPMEMSLPLTPTATPRPSSPMA